ncbi:MAG: curlin [Bradyrhizobium sp.]|nr:curlin [Bradyrhizobium sp.]
MRGVIRVWAATALLAAMSVSPEASAGSFQSERSNGKVSIETIFEFGNNVQPVVINENNQINIARVIEVGGTGPVDATIIQNGTRNVVDVFQVGATTNALIGQSGVSNTANVMQIGNVTNSLMLQIGNMNSGSVRQFGHYNWSAIFQFGR